MRKRRLYTPFKIATQTAPKTAEGMEIVDQGFWGCVARKPDGNLRKFAFRMVDPAKQEAAEAEIRAEWQNMYLLNSGITSSFQIPEPLSPLTYISSPEYFAFYDMTAIDGKPALWNRPDIFRQAGRIAGEFQAAASPFAPAFPRTKPPEWSGTAPGIPGAPDRINEALARAYDFMKDNRIVSVVHGDFHSGNLIANQNGDLIGLIDFSRTGPDSNYMKDFSNIPSSHMKYFVEGFVETSGIDVPEEMLDIIATKRHASGVSSADAHVREHSVRELHIRLSRLNHITGMNL